MRIFGHYNQNGDYIGFFNDQLYKIEDIPAPYIELTEEEHQQALSYRCKVENGKHKYLPYTEQENFQKKYNTLRNTRDQLLSQSDWTQMPDSPLTDAQKQAWAAYRQSLRDLPETVDINNIVYPEKP